jgi:hypothetical protein
MLFYIPADSQQRHVTHDFDVTYNYNNYALRGRDVDFKSEFDIVILGDSFPFGMGVDEQHTICGYLEVRGISALNLSEPATNPINYYHKFVITKKLGLKARNLVVGICIGNDFQNISDKDNVDRSLHLADKYIDYNYNIMSGIALDRVRYLIYATIHKLFIKNEFIIHQFERAKPFRYDWIEWFAEGDSKLIKEMRYYKYSSCSEDEYLSIAQINEKSIKDSSIIINHLKSQLNLRTKLSVMLIPDWHYVRHDLGLRYQYFMKMFTSLLDQSINIIDFHDKYQDDVFFQHDGHWNEKGHKLVADVLIKELKLPANNGN